MNETQMKQFLNCDCWDEGRFESCCETQTKLSMRMSETQTERFFTYTVEKLTEAKGKSKETQMKLICDLFGFDPNETMKRKWTVTKSRNLRYHPATYMLEICVSI